MRELGESEIEELDCEYCLHRKKKRALGHGSTFIPQQLLCPYENCPFINTREKYIGFYERNNREGI